MRKIKYDESYMLLLYQISVKLDFIDVIAWHGGERGIAYKNVSVKKLLNDHVHMKIIQNLTLWLCPYPQPFCADSFYTSTDV